MSSYSKIIIYSFMLILLSSCSMKNYSSSNSKSSLEESLYISIALDYEYNKNYIQSEELYSKLNIMFPDKYEYLAKTILMNKLLNNNKKVQILILKNIDVFKNKKEDMLQEYVISTFKEKQYDKALSTSLKLLKEFNNTKNYIIVADVYYLMKDYKNASIYYESAYAKNKNIKVLLNLSDILYTYLNRKKEALAYLETHHRLYSCNEKICIRLVQYYAKEENIDGIISISKILLGKFEDKYPKDKLYKIRTMIVDLYLKKDKKLAIEFLEKYKFDNQKLLSLYSQENLYEKALVLTKQMYEQSKDDSLLGQIAILEYELNKYKILPSIINNFEKSLKYKENDTYENYYGYLLIDHDMDLKKGLSLIKKAYSKNPNNLAYKDSLAYAYYKNNNCKDAYIIMSDVVKKVGLDNLEIKEHWDKIKTCKEENK